MNGLPEKRYKTILQSQFVHTLLGTWVPGGGSQTWQLWISCNPEPPLLAEVSTRGFSRWRR
jgi:hypothetical protein